jgi:hypothetical protein
MVGLIVYGAKMATADSEALAENTPGFACKTGVLRRRLRNANLFIIGDKSSLYSGAFLPPYEARKIGTE